MKVYKPVVLSISSLQIMAMAVMSPIIPKMTAEFSDTSEVLIKALVTIPAVCMLLFSQISGWMTSFVRKRLLVIIGLVLYIIGGLGAYIAANVYQILVLRLVLGIGIGLFMPMTTGLVADFYSGEERTRTIGYSQAVNYFGGVVATLFAGFVAMYSWRNAFLIYIFSVLVLIVVAIGLPEPPRKQAATIKYQILPKQIYFAAFCALLQMLVFYSAVTNIAVRLKEMGSSNTFLSSITISLLFLSCFLAGIVLTKTLAIFKGMTIFTSIIVMAVGFFLVFAAKGPVFYLVGMILIGAADGTVIPFIYSVAAKHAPAGTSGQTMATVICFLSIGQFLAPLFFQAVISVIGNNTVTGGFGGMSALLLATAIGVLAVRLRRKAGSIKVNID